MPNEFFEAWPTRGQITSAAERLLGSHKVEEQALGRYLMGYDTAYVWISPVAVVGALQKQGELEPLLSISPVEAGIRSKLYVTWGIDFILGILSELRRELCGPKKDSSKLSKKTEGTIIGLTAFLMQRFGLSNPMAYGIALAILLALARATKKTFCTMTDKQIAKALKALEP